MGLNIVEAFIVAGAADYIDRQQPSIEKSTHIERDALTVVAYDLEMEEHIKRKGIERGLGLNVKLR